MRVEHPAAKSPAIGAVFDWPISPAGRTMDGMVKQRDVGKVMYREVEATETTSVARSIQMLKSVLGGATYEEVARSHRLTRTAVERRIKEVVRQLNRCVGVPGLSEDSIGFVRRLRANGEAILHALARVDPQVLATQRRERPIRVYSTEEVAAAADRVRAYSDQPLRDVALFVLLFATGLRPLEVARLQIRDFLQPDGQVRRDSQLRAEAAINGVERPLHFSSTRLIAVLLPYVMQRAPADGGDRPYRGLDPRAPLFLASHGRGFAIAAYTQGGQRRYLCRPILETYRKIFRYARLPGGTPLAVRNTVAARLYARGAEDEHVGLLLGIAQRSTVRQRFPRIRPSLPELVEELI